VASFFANQTVHDFLSGSAEALTSQGGRHVAIEDVVLRLEGEQWQPDPDRSLAEAGLANGSKLEVAALSESHFAGRGAFDSKQQKRSGNLDFYLQYLDPSIPIAKVNAENAADFMACAVPTAALFASEDDWEPVRYDYSIKKGVGGSVSAFAQSSGTIEYQKYRHVDNVHVLERRYLEHFHHTAGEEPKLVFLFGKYGGFPQVAHGVRCEVHAFYEPPQGRNLREALALRDGMAASADRVASSMGLRRVGVLLTAPSRNFLGLSSEEIALVSQLQARPAGEPPSRFVTILMQPDAKGVVEPSAWMVSDQGVALHRDRAMAQPARPDSGVCHARESGGAMDWVPTLRVPQTMLVGASGEVEVTRAKEPRGDGGGVDTAWFMLKVGMGVALEGEALFYHIDFPGRIFLQGGDPGLEEVRRTAARRADEPVEARLDCFQMLACLGSLPEGRPHMRELCEALVAARPINDETARALGQLLSPAQPPSPAGSRPGGGLSFI